jgi:hypothetical protein
METAASAAHHLLVAEPASPPAIAAASALSLSLRSQKSVEGGKAEREIWGGRRNLRRRGSGSRAALYPRRSAPRFAPGRSHRIAPGNYSFRKSIPWISRAGREREYWKVQGGALLGGYLSRQQPTYLNGLPPISCRVLKVCLN